MVLRDMSARSTEPTTQLQALGLTADETIAYLTVVKLGLCKADEVSRESALHRTQIYQIMPRLVTIGLIQQTLDRPRRYQPTSLQHAITVLKERALIRYKEIARDTDDLIGSLEKLQARVQGTSGQQVRVITGMQNIQREIRKDLASAETEILLIMRGQYLARWRPYIRIALREMKTKHLKARAILEVKKENVSYAKWLSSVFEIRHYEPLHVHLYLVDNRSVAIGLNSQAQTAPEHVSELVTSYPSYVKMIHEFFDVTWKQAVPLNARLEMLRGHSTQSSTQTRILWGRETIHKEVADWHLRATKEISEITTGNGPIRLLRRFEKYMHEAVERNIKWRIICSLTAENLAAVKKLGETAEIRHLDRPIALGIAVLDDSEGIILHIDPDSSDLTSSPTDIALHTTNRPTAATLLRMFDSYWKRSEPIEKAIRRLSIKEAGQKGLKQTTASTRT